MYTHQVSVVVTLWTYILEVLGSNLFGETGYAKVFRGFTQSRQVPG
jgi:hypothetical protein